MKNVDQKNIDLFLRQKKLLDTFLEHHTITKDQYNKSYTDLCMLMFDATPEEITSQMFSGTAE